MVPETGAACASRAGEARAGMSVRDTNCFRLEHGGKGRRHGEAKRSPEGTGGERLLAGLLLFLVKFMEVTLRREGAARRAHLVVWILLALLEHHRVGVVLVSAVCESTRPHALDHVLPVRVYAADLVALQCGVSHRGDSKVRAGGLVVEQVVFACLIPRVCKARLDWHATHSPRVFLGALSAVLAAVEAVLAGIYITLVEALLSDEEFLARLTHGTTPVPLVLVAVEIAVVHV
mmetsp:Transcript_5840/g.20359  ORF Transcript_5840/g.20359 Transcript_5840/m.20359 type:complete len:233 (+) Transcript_5840:691-1389(+)